MYADGWTALEVEPCAKNWDAGKALVRKVACHGSQSALVSFLLERGADANLVTCVCAKNNQRESDRENT